MTTYEQFVFPLLRQLDAETAHDRTLEALSTAQSSDVGRAMLRRIAGRIPIQPITCAGIRFPNVLGIAAGFDKDARVVEGLALLGFGHIEVGTLTPRPQAGNPRPRIFRLVADEALINRMGFPNAGVAAVLDRLRRLTEKPRDYVLGISLGKQKETPLAEAANDYLEVMGAVYPHGDYLAVNVSSPNTPGLRELQGKQYLTDLLSRLMGTGGDLAEQHGLPRRPLFVKIAPDLTWPELDEILAAVAKAEVDGIIATNTTLRREGLHDPRQEESGGLSGPPVRQRSTEIIAYISRHTDGRLPIIGVGGISTAADVVDKLHAGATVVQLYTSLAYHGPGLPGRLLRGLEAAGH